MTFNANSSQIFTDALELRNVTMKASQRIYAQYEQGKAKAVARMQRIYEDVTRKEEEARLQAKRHEEAAEGNGHHLPATDGAAPAETAGAAMDTAPDAPAA